MTTVRTLARNAFLQAKQNAFLRRVANWPVIGALKARVRPWLMLDNSNYERWLADRLATRAPLYPYTPEPKLLSFVSTVWNTSVDFLRILADSVLRQKGSQPFEWVVLDNGSSSLETRTFLEQVLSRDSRVKLFRVEENLGIIRGMRFVLERATGRYIIPIDSDDRLTLDAVEIATSCIQRHGYPALLYSDEDHLLGERLIEPYFKPDWDPVLFFNSAYIAHLGVIDRQLALQLDAYSDENTNGSHDWDTFVRFLVAGHRPVHIPEQLYSWRMHPQSTAGDINSKSYIHDSHRALLNRFLASRPHAERYSVELSPLFNGTPDWWFRRQHVAARPLLSIVLSDGESAVLNHNVLSSCDYPAHRALQISRETPLETFRQFVESNATDDGLICLVSNQVEIQNSEWPWECLALMELHDDVAVVGGRLYDRNQIILDGGRHLGFGAGCDCPDRGRHIGDVGYRAQMWKQRSVGAVPSQFCVFDTAFLKAVLRNGCGSSATLINLGAWAGAYALRAGHRVVYSPFLIGQTDEDWDTLISAEERRAFVAAHRELLPDRRFYPAPLGLELSTRYQPQETSDGSRRRAA